MQDSFFSFLLILVPLSNIFSETPNLKFKKIQLSDKFYAEGATYGDLNNDEKMDLISGPYWYAGPNFTTKYQLSTPNEINPDVYSNNFFSFVYDFNQDGWNDVMVIGYPGNSANWLENPKLATGNWTPHLMVPIVENESPTFQDLTGDGKPELIYIQDARLGWATPNLSDPKLPWKFHAATPVGNYEQYTHGLGIGDVNSDGRQDILERNGWWEQPASLVGDPVWIRHQFAFATDPVEPGGGGAQMFAYDVDGDGRNDVITTLDAHRYGLAWYKNVLVKDSITFIKKMIMGDESQVDLYGISFSQLHSLALIDLDGDGLKDLVSGKRWWAHGALTDPGSQSPSVLYGWQLSRSGGNATFTPFPIDSNSGSGTQLTVGDFSGDGNPDIVIGNKKGTFAFVRTGAPAVNISYQIKGQAVKKNVREKKYFTVAGRRTEQKAKPNANQKVQ